jgi:hypothetical protein
MRSRRSNERGITKVGILVALVLLGIGAYLIYSVVGPTITVTWVFEETFLGFLAITVGIVVLWKL